MLYLISGGSGSGKSEYAESVATEKHKIEKGGLYYVATMKVYDDECAQRVEKHRQMRLGKGFETIECQSNISKLEVKENSVVLIECMSNLLANEMFSDEGNIKVDNILNCADEEIIKPIVKLSEKACVIVVTNEIFSDGNIYDEYTQKYIECLGYINRELAKNAIDVTEVVCSIPVKICGGEDR
jgi:adenosylcobinamide kinase/adenosylcobinamide-phosphate guanylyltransferase